MIADCLRVYDLKRNTVRSVLGGHNKLVTAVRMSGDGRACVTGSLDKTVKIWSLADEDCLHTLEGHEGPISAVHHNKQMVISACEQDKTVKVWDMKSGECRFTLPFPDAPVTSLAVNSTEPSGHLFFGHTDGCISTWDIETQQQVHSTKVTNNAITDFQIVGQQLLASDYSRIYLNGLYATNSKNPSFSTATEELTVVQSRSFE